MSSVVGEESFMPFRLRVILLCPLAICSWMIVTGCSSVDPVVKIALVGPFEGKHRDIGYDVIYSARLAVREANESGGVGRYRVGLVALDDFGDAESAQMTAAAVAADPAVVAIVGHWLPETTSAAEKIYVSNDLPMISTGQDPFGTVEPSTLPAEFLEAYADVTPFDEVAGTYAGTAYDAMQLVLAAMAIAENEEGVIDRTTLSGALSELAIEGITGTIYQNGTEPR